MRTSRRVAPSLEALEDRWVPATVRFSNGVLSISNPNITAQKSSLTVTQTAANTFQVKDNGQNNGTFAGVAAITIGGTNAADTVVVDLATFTYSGSLTVLPSNGNDQFDLKAAGGGTTGNLSVFAGRGNDTVSLNTTGSTGALTVAGNTQINAGTGNNTLTSGNAAAATTFLGNLYSTGMTSVTLGNGSADTFRGNVSINSANNPNALNAFIGAASTNVSNIFGSLNITGGAGDDLVLLGALNIRGNANVNLMGGDATIGNDLSLSALNNVAGVGITTIFGDLNYFSTAGVDIVDLADATVNGNANLRLGQGGSAATPSGIALDNVQATTSIGGNLLVTGGNGDFTTNPFGGPPNGTDIQATIGGSATFHFGNGDNSITFTPTSTVGGNVNYQAGNGSNSVTLAGPQLYVVNLNVGTGVDTFTLNNAAAILTGFLRAGGNPGNSFNVTAGTIGSPFTLVGFP
jgi:hypothetical protein